MSSSKTSWISTNLGHINLPGTAARFTAYFGNNCHALFPNRLLRQTLIRYRIELKINVNEANKPEPAALTPVTEEFIQELQSHPWRKQPQIQTALHLWNHGLRSGYVWIEDGKPLCMQWLFSHQDNSLLKSLPIWAGLYPPLQPDCGQVENILTFPAGLRRPGGAASAFSQSMHTMAVKRGIKRLTTHISESNGAARIWAQRTGWSPYGYVFRYQIDFPGLRQHQIYLHTNTNARSIKIGSN